MKTLSVKQPWASLIIDGIKDIENRTWKLPSNMKGQRVLIHASKCSWSWDKFTNYIENIDCESMELQNFVLTNKISEKWLKQLPTGMIIGSVEVVDCVINHKSMWAEKTEGVLVGNEFFTNEKSPTVYNWVLANPLKLTEPIPAKGKLLFWDYPININL